MNSVLNIFRTCISANAAGYRRLTMSHFVDKVKFQPEVYESKRFEDLFYKRAPLVSTDKLEAWRDHYREFVKDVNIVSDHHFEVANESSTWVQDVVNYNTPYGKGIRAFQVILADKYLCNDTSPENVQSVNSLAWLMELFQAAACISDDIMDESETRRDRLCWYKVNNQGIPAFNDGILLLNAIPILLDRHFGHTNFYAQLVEVFVLALQAGLYGEGSDVRNAKQKNFYKYNVDSYEKMMMFKNGFYTFYAPVACAMIKNGISDDGSLKEVEKLALDLGLIYSIQDDFMDCFIDSKLTGKVGTDIEEGKCTWLFVNALEICSTEQRRMLIENYGSRDQSKVNLVKRLYRDIGIPQLYKNWEKDTMTRTVKSIGQLSTTRLQPLFYDLLATICGRVR